MAVSYTGAVQEAQRRIRTAREGINALAEEIRERGHAHAGPSIQGAWILYRNAHRAVRYAEEVADFVNCDRPHSLAYALLLLREALRNAEMMEA